MIFKEYLKEVLLCIIIILLIGLYCFIWYILFYNQKEDEEILLPEVQIENEQNKLVQNISVVKKYVDIKGAVKKPGVFAITEDTIVNDVVNQAGGFTNNAYTSNINLSKKLDDETVIYVYTKSEYEKLAKEEVKEIIVEKECVCPDVDISDCIQNGTSIIKPNGDKDDTKEENINNDVSEDTLKDESSNLVNINTALLDELTSLNGIGEAKAQNIINYRTQNGLFNSIEDVKEVSGISDAIYEKIKDFITV